MVERQMDTITLHSLQFLLASCDCLVHCFGLRVNTFLDLDAQGNCNTLTEPKHGYTGAG